MGATTAEAPAIDALFRFVSKTLIYYSMTGDLMATIAR
jgi:hypothetical protein